jgi:low affinity Fe/Cu permease
VVWALFGPAAHYSSTWQLMINTGTTIVTFLMVFLIQNTQNRDSAALHLKVDELLKALQEARTELVDLEDAPDAELDALKQEFGRTKVEAKQAAHEAGPGSPAGEENETAATARRAS